MLGLEAWREFDGHVTYGRSMTLPWAVQDMRQVPKDVEMMAEFDTTARGILVVEGR